MPALARLRAFAAHLPTRSPARLARQLVARADAARDRQQWQAAAALYEEALALAPARRRIHIQCGHVLKEAGAFDQAEAHYHAAMAAFPNDADLALQTGHFFKTAGRLDEAEAAYARALALRPHWAEAEGEITRLTGTPVSPGPGAAPVPGLLPRGPAEPPPERDAIVVQQLGRELVYRGGTRRVLRGVQAIRGHVIASKPVVTLELWIDGAVARSEPLHALPLPRPMQEGQAKYVFNLWHDFSACPPGEHAVELRFVDARGQHRAHRAMLLVEPPAPHAASDAYVPPPPPGAALDDWVNGLPSVVRPAERRLVPASPAAVLVQRVDQLGDLVCSEPALRRLRALFPAARLVGLVSPANADLARALELFDAVEVVRWGEGRTLDAPAQEELRRRLGSHAFDLAIDLGEGDASRPLLQLSGAPFLYGFRPRDFPWLSAGLEVDARDPLDRLEAGAHSGRLLALVEGLAALVGPRARIVPRTAASPELLRRFGIAPDRRYAVLHTGARLAFSRWPGFPALARLLLDHTDVALLLMRDADQAALDLPRSERLRVIEGPLPFDTFDALLAGAAVFVGNDSGPKHLAALRGVPVVSLHMARLNWSEWGQEQTGAIVSRRVPCAGCGIAAHPEECGRDFACLRLIRPDEVLAAVLAELAELDRRPAAPPGSA